MTSRASEKYYKADKAHDQICENPPRWWKTRLVKGIAFLMASSFFFALMATCVKLAGDLPFIQKVFFRNSVAFVVALVILLKARPSFNFSGLVWKDLILRATAGTIGLMCNFYAIDHLHLADANTLGKLAPFFTIVASYFVLKEKIRPYHIVGLLIAFAGCILIARPTGELGGQEFAALLGVCGALAAGFAYTYVRKLGNEGVPKAFIVFFFAAFSTLIILPQFIIGYEPMSWLQFAILMGAGICATLAQFAITAAYSYAPAREISVFDYNQVLFSALLGFFFFGEVPVLLSWVAYTLIIGAAIMVYVFNRKIYA